MKQTHILTLSFDEGVDYIWGFNTEFEMDVWNHIILFRDDYNDLFEYVRVNGEKNKDGYNKKLKDVKSLTPEKLKEICDSSYVDGDSFPIAQLHLINNR